IGSTPWMSQVRLVPMPNLSDRRNLEDAFDNKLHAFCRMTTHIHLLLAACRSSFLLLPSHSAPMY
ncbi:hypothetical protein ACLBVR_26855, partial [Pseudomonas aeruginosa]